MQIDGDEAVIVSHGHVTPSCASVYAHIQGLCRTDHAASGSRMAAGQLLD